MKKLNLLTITIMLAFASVSFGQITGSAHDFSSKAYTTEICITCHTPHNADITVTSSPLWNHELSSESNYTLYSNANHSTINATMGQPNGISKLCLSCHDGTVAVDNFGGATGPGNTHYVTTGDLGTDLSDDHPISFEYDDNLASTDGELKTPSSDLSGLGGTIHADLLINGNMECSSCHDVHNGAGIDKLLVKTNVASALCLTCHDK